MGEPAGFFKLRPLEFDLGDMLVQIVAVALGVVLGFSATAWSERNHQRDLLRQTVGNIVSEIGSNQSGMRKVMAEHTKAAAALRETAAPALAGEPVALAGLRAALRKAGPFRENVPLAIAWQIAQNDQGLTLLPYGDRYDLAWVYQVQAIYYQKEERYETSILTLAASPDGNYAFQAADLANQLRAVVLTERQLDGLYAQALTRAKSEFKL